MASQRYVSGNAKPVGGTRGEIRGWYFMRWSGLVLVFLVMFHLWLNHIQTEVGTLSYDLVVGRFTKWPLLRVVDFLILALGLGHGVNGIKHLIDDHVHEPGKRMAWLTFLWLMFLAFLAAGTAVLFVLPVEGM